jgi:tetratricopeptide (TPR) repeat protein
MPGFYIQRARAYLAHGDYNQALADFDVLMSLAPAPFLYLERGDIHYNRGDLNAAADDYQQYIEMGGEAEGPTPRRMARIIFQLRMQAAGHEGRYQARRWF